MKDISVNLTSSSATTFDTPWHNKSVTSKQVKNKWGSATSSNRGNGPNNNIPAFWGLNSSQTKSSGTTMVDSGRKLNNEQEIADNVVSFITADNTEESVPFTSKIIVSKEQLRGKEKPKLLLVFYDGPKITDNIRLARELEKWK